MSSQPCRESDSDLPGTRPVRGLTQDQNAICTMIFARRHSGLPSLLPKIQPWPVADPTYLTRDPAPGSMRSLSRMPSSPCATRRPQSVPHALPRRSASPASRTHIPAIFLRTRLRHQRHCDEAQTPAHVASAPNSLHGLSGRPPCAPPWIPPAGHGGAPRSHRARGLDVTELRLGVEQRDGRASASCSSACVSGEPLGRVIL